MQNEDSLDALLIDLKSEIHKYCELLSGNTLLDSLFLQGLCLQHFRAVIFGLLIVAKNRCFKIDLDEFSKHLHDHQLFDISEACGQCKYLCTVDAKVCVAINDHIPKGDDRAKFNKQFGDLCEHIYDASGIQTNWTIVCTVNGPFLPEQQHLSVKLYDIAFLSVIGGSTKRIKEAFEPEYIDLGKRIETFRDRWPKVGAPDAVSMAKAGFYFLAKPDRVKCYYCGFSQDVWEKEDDPLIDHAKFIPSCPHILNILPAEHFQKEKISVNTLPVEKYRTYQSRLATFDSFEASKNCVKSVDCNAADSETVKDILANAGFFYRGIDAIVQCFSCGLKLLFTDYELDPWVLHADLSSYCTYLNEIKGKHFIQTVIQSKRRGSIATTIDFLIKKLDSDHRSDIKDMFLFNAYIVD